MSLNRLARVGSREANGQRLFDAGGGGASRWTAHKPDTVWADSANGDDSNDGLTASTPVQTLAQAQAVLDAQGFTSLALARGSTWTEQLGLWSGEGTALPDGCTVEAYGTGADPIIDATDEITGVWTSQGNGRYSKSVTLDHALPANDQHELFVIEDGEPLQVVADNTAVEATAGTLAHVTTDGSATYTLHIQASDSGDPGSNGKTYRVASRMTCVRVTGGGTVRGLDLRGACHKDGSLVCGGSDEYTVTDCTFRWGWNHMSLCGNPRFARCLWHTDTHGLAHPGNSAAHVSYVGSVAGLSGSFTDCVWKDLYGLACYAHGDASTVIASLTYTRCVWDNCGAGESSLALAKTFVDCSFYECGGDDIASHDGTADGSPLTHMTSTATLSLTRVAIYNATSYDGKGVPARQIDVTVASGGVTLTDVLLHKTYGGQMYYGTAPVATHCTLTMADNPGGAASWMVSCYSFTDTVDDGSLDYCLFHDIDDPGAGGDVLLRFGRECRRTVFRTGSNLTLWDSTQPGGSEQQSFSSLVAAQAAGYFDFADVINGIPTYESEADANRPLRVLSSGSAGKNIDGHGNDAGVSAYPSHAAATALLAAITG